MNRRNVLGNRIEESKTLWVIIIGILVTAIQFAVYHFVNGGGLGLLLAAVAALVGSVVVHFITTEQEELMSFLLIPCTFSGVVGLMLPYAEIPFLPEGNVVLLGCLITWLVPVLYATIYTWANGNTEIAGFAKFYSRALVLFYLVYFALMVYGTFANRTAAEAGNDAQWIPFATFAALVNGVMKDTVSVARVLEFLLNRIVFFLPYGFFIGLVCRKLHGVLRVFLLVFLPVALEAVSLLFRWDTCDIDNVIFRFIGALLGFVSFLVFDLAFQHFTARHFNGSEISRDYYGRKI
jgi:glycopeptide antibiotics resistance protein